MARDHNKKEIIFCGEDDGSINIKEANRLAKENKDKRVVILLNNTIGLTEEKLKELDENVEIRIQGPYDPERITNHMRLSFVNSKHNLKIPAKKYYTFSVIYTRNEVINLLREIKKIEKGIKPNFSDVQKLYYFYDTIKKTITYDPEYEDKTDKQVRTLRGLRNKKTVCAGYAVILKELLDRQNIESYFLGGHGHAWNVVKIEDKYYPIDITWENRYYRSGDMRTNYFFGQDPDIFLESHHVDEKDPNKDLMKKLSSFDRDFVSFLASTVTSEERFYHSSFMGSLDNGQEFMLIQIGTTIINGEKYYKYYFRETTECYKKISSEPLIITTKVNLCGYKDAVSFKRKNKDEKYEDFVAEKMFTRENINDSLRKGSTYIGDVKSYEGTRGFINTFNKDGEDMRSFPKKYKYIKRKDNTGLLIEIDDFSLRTGDQLFIRYNVYDLVGKNYELRKRIVYSEYDILKEKNPSYELFEESNIDEAINNRCGYIGNINSIGNIIYETKSDFFNPNKKISVTDYEKKIKNKVIIPSFEELREYYKKYRFLNDKYESIENVEVIERGSKKKLVDDRWTKMHAYFALLWQDSIGRGLEAFNSENEDIFYDILNRIITNIKKTNFIDTIGIYKSFSNDPKRKEIFLNLFSEPERTRFLTEYIYKSVKPDDKINGEPVALANQDFADLLVEASNKRR